MKKLFTYAIIFQGKEATKDKPEEKSEILVAPQYTLAKDDKEVAIRASRELPDSYLDKLDQVEIIVRPF